MEADGPTNAFSRFLSANRIGSKRARTRPMIQQPDTDQPFFGSGLLLAP